MSTEFEESGLKQELADHVKGERKITQGMPELARRAAAEGCVLLKNQEVLPLTESKKVSVFGRCQVDTFYVGYGSGGDIHPPYRVSILDGLRNCAEISLNEELAKVYEEWCRQPKNIADPGTEWGKWPHYYPEMQLEEEMVTEAAAVSDIAVIIIGRAAGEERENKLEPGSYYLKEEEKRMITLVRQSFEQVVLVLNCGNIIDLSWTKDCEMDAILWMWLGGMESGNALADVLSGKVNPCGKLTDTIALHYEDYPSAENFGNPEYNNYEEDIYVGYRYFETFARDKILYSFGYGLSYTTFETEALSCSGTVERVELSVRVRNTGKCAGKEVVQVYIEPPQGVLGKEFRRLVAFKKTELIGPGKEQDLTFVITAEQMVSYDDTGKTGYPQSYVMEAGQCFFFYGVSDEAGRLRYQNAGGSDNRETISYGKLNNICPVKDEFSRIMPVEAVRGYNMRRKTVREGQKNLRERILANLPEQMERKNEGLITFEQVKQGEASLIEFTAQLTKEELQSLTRGEGSMNRPAGIEGNTGIFGGFLDSMKEKKVPIVVTADGPAGLRVRRYTSLLPCGTAIACTWDEDLTEQLFEKIAVEIERFDVDMLLSPGLNIHRNPLCGRNFEYFSEDPYVSGKIAAAAVRGIQSLGASACPKHFACNNQEFRRNMNDSRVSERALREIYLRGFEICVKEGRPRSIMTSYNMINGVYSHYNYDLATEVLRNEWGYEGLVITDWWMQKRPSPEFPKMRDHAYRVRAGVDVFMPGNNNLQDEVRDYVPDETLLETLGEEDGITMAELQQTAMRVLKFMLEMK